MASIGALHRVTMGPVRRTLGSTEALHDDFAAGGLAEHVHALGHRTGGSDFAVFARFDRLEDRMATGFSAVDAKCDRIDERFDRVNEGFDRMDARLDDMSSRINGLSERRAAVEAR